MKTEKTSKKVAYTGLIAAIAASSCCIPPVIALFAGIGGSASALSFMEPFRPYLIALAVVAIGYAWYNYFKPKKEDDCGCDIEKPKWFQTKGFLIGITLFAAISIAFPHYSYIFYPDKKVVVVTTSQSTINETTYHVKGMTCESCNLHIENEVSKLPGYIDAKADYKTGTVKVKYDNSKSSKKEVEATINDTGYKIIGSNNSEALNQSDSYNSLLLNVKGMTCESCNLHVEHEVSKLPGYVDAKADYKTGTVKVTYDSSKSTEKEVVDAVNNTGYKVVKNK